MDKPKTSINMATKQFEGELISLINNSGLPEINVLLVLNSVMNLASQEFDRKINEELAEMKGNME